MGEKCLGGGISKGRDLEHSSFNWKTVSLLSDAIAGQKREVQVMRELRKLSKGSKMSRA